jgi:hypothetical protein
MNQCPYCNVNIAEGYVGEVELESHLKEIHEVSFQTMHEAEAWWDKKYVPLGRPSWADMNIGQRRKTINAYLTRSPSTEMRGFLKCPKCGITFNDSENTDDDLTIHLMKDHQVPEDLAEEMTTFEVGKNGLQPTDGWAAFESDPNPSKMFLDQLQNAGRDGNPNMYWNEEERQYTNDPLRDVSFDPKAGAPWQKNADLESLASEDDPDYLNDPDYQGYTQDKFGNQVKSHPSQYTLSGWDWEEKERMNARGDVDFAFDSKASEGLIDNLDDFQSNFDYDRKPTLNDWLEFVFQINNYDKKIYNKLEAEAIQVWKKHTGESKANEDSLVKIEDDGKKITTLDEWEGESLASEIVSYNKDVNDVWDVWEGGAYQSGSEDDWINYAEKNGIDEEDASYKWYKEENNESYSNEGPFNFTDTEWESFPKETQNQITDELTIKDLQEDSNMTDEGFVDKIDMLANKMGINLDRDPDQYSSEAGSDGDLDWITVNGSHIPINAGQDKGDAIGDFFDKKSDSSKTKKDTKKKDTKKEEPTKEEPAPEPKAPEPKVEQPKKEEPKKEIDWDTFKFDHNKPAGPDNPLSRDYGNNPNYDPAEWSILNDPPEKLASDITGLPRFVPNPNYDKDAVWDKAWDDPEKKKSDSLFKGQDGLSKHDNPDIDKPKYSLDLMSEYTPKLRSEAEAIINRFPDGQFSYNTKGRSDIMEDLDYYYAEKARGHKQRSWEEASDIVSNNNMGDMPFHDLPLYLQKQMDKEYKQFVKEETSHSGGVFKSVDDYKKQRDAGNARTLDKWYDKPPAVEHVESKAKATESCSRDCDIYKATNGKWYMELEECGREYEGNGRYETFGPYSSEDEAINDTGNHGPNPGGFSTNPSGTRQPPF